MKQAFIDHRFSGKSYDTIKLANGIIEEYQRRGFTLTLRQLYYQFVARGLIPNSQKEYTKLGSVLNKGRLAGYIDWEAIEDRTRNLRELPYWSSPSTLINAAAEQYRCDIWDRQPARVEVWIEKDALIGVVEPVCNEFRVPYFACRGYSSQSEQWRAGRRISACLNASQKVVILHLGDHDPSGVDMSRDNENRLRMFAQEYGDDFAFLRIALTKEQVDQYNPPPNPAKLTDTRSTGYIELYGDESWELDALDPTVIDGLIRQEIMGIRDEASWDAVVEEEEAARSVMQNISDNWEDVVEQFGGT